MMKIGFNRKSTSNSTSAQHKGMSLSSINIVKKLPGIVYWKDKEGVYSGCNDALLEMAGMDVIGKTDYDLPWGNQANQLRQNDLDVMTRNNTMEVEEYITLANGQQAILLTQKTPVLDNDNNTIGVLGISFNITERKNYESTLKAINEQTEFTLENIVANMPGHVYWKDRKGVYMGCNNRQAKSLGFKYSHEIIGKADFNLPWGINMAELFQKNDFRIMETGKSEIIEEESRIDGKKFIVLSHKTPMHNKSGEITGVLGISIDITDRKKIEMDLKEAKERAEAANAAKTEFLENMRHDIRTPLTGITGFANIIKAEVKDPAIKEYIENLSVSSDALLDLLNEILEIIQINSGGPPSVKKKFSLEKRVQEIVNLYKAKARQKNIELITDFDTSIPDYLIGDSIRIHRVALELVANALNFTHSGFVKITTQLAKSSERDVVIRLMVEDTGVGIAPDKQEEIFLQFKRLTPSYKGIYKGTGLGLTIVKQFIDDLQGEIYVASEPGSGSLFTCILPIKKALLNEESGCETIIPTTASLKSGPVHRPSPLPSSVDFPAKSTVLIVEDNTIAAMVAKIMLSSLDCNVEIASDGKKAVQLMEQNDFDLIFMDIGLPDIDGFEATRRMRLYGLNKGVQVPIIALTAHLDEENKQFCLQAGMNAVLTKPLTKEISRDILNSFIPYRMPQNRHAVSGNVDDKIIDFELAKKQFGGNHRLVHEMLTILVDSFAEELTLFDKAFIIEDWTSIQNQAHKMKSGAGYCGTERLKTACELLERAVKQNQQPLYTSLYKHLITEIHLVKTEFMRNKHG